MSSSRYLSVVLADRVAVDTADLVCVESAVGSLTEYSIDLATVHVLQLNTVQYRRPPSRSKEKKVEDGEIAPSKKNLASCFFCSGGT